MPSGASVDTQAIGRGATRPLISALRSPPVERRRVDDHAPAPRNVLRREPMPSISTSTTSPSRRYVPARLSHAARRPGRDHVAGLELDDPRNVGDERRARRRRDRRATARWRCSPLTVRRISALVEVAELVGRDDPRPDGRGRLERLAGEPLDRAALEVARRDVVQDRQPGDVRPGVLAGDVAAAVPITTASSPS